MDVEAFRKSLKFQCTATSETVLTELGMLRQWDQGTELELADRPEAELADGPEAELADGPNAELADRPEYRGCYLVACGSPVAMILFFVSKVMLDRGANPWFGVVFLVAATVATIASIVGLLRARNSVKLRAEYDRKAGKSAQTDPDKNAGKLSRIDLDHRRYELVAGLVQLLSADIRSDALLAVDIDFRAHDHREKRLPTRYIGDGNINSYIDHWLQLRGRLVDGTKFTIRLIEKQQLSRRQKNSASGKQKIKTKTKTSSEAILTLKVKPKRYPRIAQQHEVMDQYVKMPEWAVLKSVDVSGPQLTLRSTTTSVWSAGAELSKEGETPKEDAIKCDGVQWVAMMLVSSYEVLKRSR